MLCKRQRNGDSGEKGVAHAQSRGSGGLATPEASVLQPRLFHGPCTMLQMRSRRLLRSKACNGNDRNREMPQSILEEWNDMPSTATGSVEGRMARLEYNVPVSSVTFKKVAAALRRMGCQRGTREPMRLGCSVSDSRFTVDNN